MGLKEAASGHKKELDEAMRKLKEEVDSKAKTAAAAEGHVAALQKQLEELLLEYDRLLEDNQNLQRQALVFRS